MLEKIKFNKEYVLRKLETGKETKYYALNIKNGECFEINETSNDILSMIRENLSKSEIFDKLKNTYENFTRFIFESDYEELVKMSIELGILLHE